MGAIAGGTAGGVVCNYLNNIVIIIIGLIVWKCKRTRNQTAQDEVVKEVTDMGKKYTEDENVKRKHRGKL